LESWDPPTVAQKLADGCSSNSQSIGSQHKAVLQKGNCTQIIMSSATMESFSAYTHRMPLGLSRILLPQPATVPHPKKIGTTTIFMET
jgi:hypothetical protein